MSKRTMTAITLALAAALVALPAYARTEALLIGSPSSGDALAALGARLKSGFGAEEVQVALPTSSREIAQKVRKYLGTSGKAGDLRVVWILAHEAVCPNFDEAPVRPQVRTLVVAPPCVKLLIQAPTTYERLGADARDDPGSIDRLALGVAFVSVTGDVTANPADFLAKASGPLLQTLACRRSGLVSLDFSPGVAAWGVSASSCEPGPLVAAAPAVPPLPSAAPAAVPEKAPEPAASPEPAAQGGGFKLAAPVNGNVVSPFGADVGGKPNRGQDIEVAAGTVVKAAEAGEVVFVGELSGYGQVVAVKHDNDWATVYAHTAHLRVKQGQKVSKGQDLADIDPSHKLHFELRRKGKPMDPEPMIAITG